MKKYFRIMAIFMIICLTVSCLSGLSDVNASALHNITLSTTSAAVAVGKTISIKLNGTNQTTIWTSENKKVAAVNSKGVVTGIKNGLVDIDAKIGNQKFICNVLVSNDKEICGAVNRGLASSKFAANSNGHLSEKEFCKMLVITIKRLGYKPDSNISGLSSDWGSSKDIDRKLAAMRLNDVIYDTFGYKGFIYDHKDEVLDAVNAKGKSDDYTNYIKNVSAIPDLKSGLPLMELSKTEKGFYFRRNDKLTIKEAVHAVYRFLNSGVSKVKLTGIKAPALTKIQSEAAKYVNVDSVGTYNKNIITSQLLNQKTSLPDASSKHLPYWKGFDFEDKESRGEGYRYIYEDVFKYISQNKFNCALVQYSFSFMSNPKNANEVNVSELKQLDQIISWGMKYGVHIIISCTGVPGFSYGKNQYVYEYDSKENVSRDDCPLYTSAATAKLTERYWAMLARRYANIPNKYLSFELFWEPNIMDQAKFTKICTPMVQDIWKYNPKRIVFINTSYVPESLMKLGCCASVHNYIYSWLKNMKDDVGTDYQRNWPILYLPFTLYQDNTISFKSKTAFSKGTLKIKAEWGKCTVFMDGVKTYTSEEISNNKWIQTAVPDGTKEIQVKANEGFGLRAVVINQSNGISAKMAASDYYGMLGAGNASIQIAADGTATNMSGTTHIDADYIYDSMMKPSVEAAKKYNVGFMMTEIGGMQGTDLPEQWYKNYIKMYLEVLKKHQIPWICDCTWDVCVNTAAPNLATGIFTHILNGEDITVYGKNKFIIYRGKINMLKEYQ